MVSTHVWLDGLASELSCCIVEMSFMASMSWQYADSSPGTCEHAVCLSQVTAALPVQCNSYRQYFQVVARMQAATKGDCVHGTAHKTGVCASGYVTSGALSPIQVSVDNTCRATSLHSNLWLFETARSPLLGSCLPLSRAAKLCKQQKIQAVHCQEGNWKA